MVVIELNQGSPVELETKSAPIILSFKVIKATESFDLSAVRAI